MKLFNFAVLLALAAPLSGAAVGDYSAHDMDITQRTNGNMELSKRFSDSRWTFYNVGLGTCGEVNVPSDFVVALNVAQFGSGFPGPNCFRNIIMQYNNKTTIARIMDECPGCPLDGLDLSTGLFEFFDTLDKGVLFGSWSFEDGGPVATAALPTPPRSLVALDDSKETA